MSETHRVLLRDRQQDTFVEALLLERIDVDYALRADNAWLTFLAIAKAQATAANRPYEDPEYSHWRWEQKVRATAHLLSMPTIGVECAGQVQGLLMLLTDGQVCRLRDQLNQPLVYVTFVAAAPWNLAEVVPEPRYSGVGTVLLRFAVQTSLDLGFKGRIGLHSLPRAETWYERYQLHCLGPDAAHQNLKYYEMTPSQAADFIR